MGSPYDYKDNIGVMCIYFNRDYIQSVLDNMQMFPSGFSMIVNENQEILLKSSNAPEDISGFATYIKMVTALQLQERRMTPYLYLLRLVKLVGA